MANEFFFFFFFFFLGGVDSAFPLFFWMENASLFLGGKAGGKVSDVSPLLASLSFFFFLGGGASAFALVSVEG